jgi:hypothetical protein
MRKRKKPYLQAVILGIISITSYIVLFANRELVMEHFTRGGMYTTLPIVTVFYFSFLHGAFASNVLSVLGLEAAKSRKK